MLIPVAAVWELLPIICWKLNAPLFSEPRLELDWLLIESLSDASKLLFYHGLYLRPELYGLKDLSVQLEQLDGAALTWSTELAIILRLNGDMAEYCVSWIREIPK